MLHSTYNISIRTYVRIEMLHSTYNISIRTYVRIEMLHSTYNITYNVHIILRIRTYVRIGCVQLWIHVQKKRSHRDLNSDLWIQSPGC